MAPFGIIGLETALSVINTYVVQENHIGWADVVNKMAHNPRNIMQQPKVIIKEGEAANLVCFDPNETWTVSEDDFGSKSRNSPYIGKALKGKILGIIRDQRTTITSIK